MINTLLKERLNKRHQENSFRKLVVSSNLIDFSSNDYLGFARSEKLFQLIQAKVENLPHVNGATGSRLLTGNSLYTEEVEQKLAFLFRSESALIFNSGYAANQAVLSCIPQKGDTIVYDELVHACMRDGARISNATRLPFRHNDLADLETKLKKVTGNIFVAVESIYSMDGDQPSLHELCTLCEKYHATIIFDEAHSTGVAGPKGAGLAVAQELHNRIPIRIYTFGKAMGAHGACVVGSKILIDYLVNFARPFIFSTAMPQHSIASIDCAFQFLEEHQHLQNELAERINVFTNLTDHYHVNRLNSSSQIQGIIIPGNEKVKLISDQLKTSGFDVRPILSPTVMKGSERLRICLHTYNSCNEIQNLVKNLAHHLKVT